MGRSRRKEDAQVAEEGKAVLDGSAPMTVVSWRWRGMLQDVEARTEVARRRSGGGGGEELTCEGLKQNN